MVSDGASFNTWNAATMYQGKAAQSYEGAGWVKLPMTTYPLNTASSPTPGLANGGYDPAKVYGAGATYATIREGYTDSASAGTALAAGIKTYNNAINWNNETSAPMKGIWEIAKENGFATGSITSVQWSHATPAAFGAHNISRNNYAAISHEMLTSGKLDVIMGAGNPDYTDSNTFRSTGQNYNYVGGATDWAALKSGTMTDTGDSRNWNLVESKTDFANLAVGTALTKVVGTAQAATTLQQARSGNKMGSLNAGVPDLATMATGALNVLKNNVNAGAKGSFLMIEGGAVDWAAHAAQAGRMIEEQVDFNNAVEAVIGWVNTNSNWNETLLIVTTDHGNNVPVGTLGANAATPFYTGLDASLIAPGATDATLESQIKFAKGAFVYNGDHTNELVPMYAYGHGADQFFNTLDGTDTLYKSAYGLDNTWGTSFIDNTDVFKVMDFAITGAAVPEPVSLGLLSLLGLAAGRRVRR
jgi:alkaline phosphatase